MQDSGECNPVIAVVDDDPSAPPKAAPEFPPLRHERMCCNFGGLLGQDGAFGSLIGHRPPWRPFEPKSGG